MTDRERFLGNFNVPRGTALLFDLYADLLIEWQSRMNLVAQSTLNQIWHRHFADSAQLVALAPGGQARWIDIGSGAGFPGLVVAMLSDHRVTLLESVTKKCRFLQAIIEQLDLRTATLVNERAETADRGEFDVISARACAPLVRLFELGYRHAQTKTRWLLPKGETVDREIEEARHSFDFRAELVPSRTDPRGRVVVATDVRRKAMRR